MRKIIYLSFTATLALFCANTEAGSVPLNTSEVVSREAAATTLVIGDESLDLFRSRESAQIFANSLTELLDEYNDGIPSSDDDPDDYNDFVQYVADAVNYMTLQFVRESREILESHEIYTRLDSSLEDQEIGYRWGDEATQILREIEGERDTLNAIRIIFEHYMGYSCGDLEMLPESFIDIMKQRLGLSIEPHAQRPRLELTD